jgi:hypothetical protein
MKTTVDLPVDLVREIKHQAVREGRKLKDTMTELLRKGMRASSSKGVAKPSRVKLPLIQCHRAGTLTPAQVATALLKQETEWHHEAS